MVRFRQQMRDDNVQSPVIQLTILSSSPGAAEEPPDRLEPRDAEGGGAGPRLNLGRQEEDRSRRSPSRNPMARPGRKLAGRTPAASHGSSCCEGVNRGEGWV
jgi:hypothetical protein